MLDFYIAADTTQWWSTNDPITSYSPAVKNFSKDDKQDLENDGYSWFCTVDSCYFGCTFKKPKASDQKQDIEFVSGQKVSLVAGFKHYLANNGKSYAVGYSDATTYTQITVGAEALTASAVALLALALAQ